MTHGHDLAFLVDVTKFMAELNVRLQGKTSCFTRMCQYAVTFIQTLKLVLKKVVHCPVLSSRSTDAVQHEKYLVNILLMISSKGSRISEGTLAS